jgi:hypothetical protein
MEIRCYPVSGRFQPCVQIVDRVRVIENARSSNSVAKSSHEHSKTAPCSLLGKMREAVLAEVR